MMVAEMTALTAAAAMATVIIEPEKRCMMVSFCSEVCFLDGSPSTPKKFVALVFVAALGPRPCLKARFMRLRRERRRRDEISSPHLDPVAGSRRLSRSGLSGHGFNIMGQHQAQR